MAAKKSGMATGVEVARISVKVSPDTSMFREELRRKLKALKQGLDDQGVVDLDADVDTDKVEKKVEKSAKRMSKNKVNLFSSAKDVDKTAKAVGKVQLGNIAKDISNSISALDQYAGKFDVKKNIFWDPKEAAAATKVALEESKRIDDIMAKRKELALSMLKGNPLYLNTSSTKKMEADFSRSVNAMQKKFDNFDLKWDKKIRDFKLGPSIRKEFVEGRTEANRLMQDLEIAAERARAAGDNIDKAFSTADKKTVRTVFTEYINGVKNLNGEVAKSPKGGVFAAFGKGGGGYKGPDLLPSFGSGINAPGMALIAATALVALAPVVGLITTGLLALPGIIGLMLAPIAAVGLALDGIKEAAKVLEEPFNNLRKRLSETAKSQFAPMFESVAKIFPTLEKSIPFVTQGLADMGKSVADFFAQGEGQQMLENTISGIGKALTQMSPGVRDFVAALTGLADEFVNGGALEGLGDWFNDTMADFRAWVAEVSASGELTTAFENLGKTIKTVLDFLGQLGAKGFNFMAQEGAIDGFNATLEKIGDTIVKITEFSAKLNQQWQSLVQIGRGVGIFTDLLSGDVGGAWSNAKDLFSNKPWQEGGGGGIDLTVKGADVSTREVERLNAAMENSQFAASQAKDSLSQLIGGEAPGKIQGPGFNGDYPLAGEGATATKPKVQAPDTTEAEAKLTEYKAKAEETMNAAKTAIESATTATVKAPDLGEFSGAFDKLPEIASQAMQRVSDSVASGGAAAAGQALLVGQNIYNAIAGTAPLFQTVGLQMMAGLAAGIQAGSASAISAAVSAATSALSAAKGALGIKSPSRKFMEIGDYSMQGMAKGMENGIQPVIDQAKELAGKVAQAFADGSDPTVALKGLNQKEINRMEKLLGWESKRNSNRASALDYQYKMTGNESLKVEADRLRLLQREADEHKSMLDLANEYNDTTSSGGGEDPFVKAASGLMSMPGDFAAATGKQFLSDLGIRGDGMIGNAITEGIKYVFNIGSVDEALSIKDREDSKAAMSAMGR